MYYENMAVLRTEADFYDLATAYLRRAAGQGVRHAEIFFDRRRHLSRACRCRWCSTGCRRR
ncbi:hypothetical protein GCM10020220_073480 [Nonomuraea rubra]